MNRQMRWVMALFVVGCLAVMAAPAAAQEEKAVVPVLRLGGSVQEVKGPFDFFGKRTVTLTDLESTVRRAAEDEKVEAMVLRLEFPGFGFSQATTLRRALVEFRETGKPLYVSSDYYTLGGYYIASAGSKIAMPEVGALDLYGMSLSAYYLKDMLGKLGIEADVIASGKFKDALDPLTRSSMSEGTRIQLEALAEDLFGEVRDEIARTREISPEKAEEILTQGPYFGRGALESGAVDVLADLEEFLTLVKEDLDKEVEFDAEYASRRKRAEPVNLMNLLTGTIRRPRAVMEETPKIALVYALGPIMDGRSESTNPLMAEQVVASDDFIELLEEAIAEPGVRALVLRVDSPGGSAIASDRIWNQVRSIREDGFPVVVSMGNIAASGGYYISAGADEIFAEPTTITGSIGTVGGKLLLAGTYDKIGVTKESIGIGPYSDIYSETSKWSELERERLEALLEDAYNMFLDRVAVSRDSTREEVDEVAQGRVWSGKSALDVGLVDALGGLEDALARARELADVPDATTVVFPKELTLVETLQKIFSGAGVSSRVAPRGVAALAEHPLFAALEVMVSEQQARHLLLMLHFLGERTGVAALMPAMIEVEGFSPVPRR